jgi:hypothetical protein
MCMWTCEIVYCVTLSVCDCVSYSLVQSSWLVWFIAHTLRLGSPKRLSDLSQYLSQKWGQVLVAQLGQVSIMGKCITPWSCPAPVFVSLHLTSSGRQYPGVKCQGEGANLHTKYEGCLYLLSFASKRSPKCGDMHMAGRCVGTMYSTYLLCHICLHRWRGDRNRGCAPPSPDSWSYGLVCASLLII